MISFNLETKLRHLLNTWWPAVNTPGCHVTLVQGLTAASWRIDLDDQIVLVRTQTVEKSVLGISRKREARLLRRSGKGLGPQVLAQSNHWIIVEWLIGQCATNKGLNALNQCGALAEMVAGLHRSPLSGYRLNLQKQLASYWYQLDKRRLTPAWLGYQQHFLRTTPPTPLKIAPLHMDIHPGNLVISTTGLRLIDWEYATDGDVALDIAVLFRNNDWTSDQQDCFLQHYTQHGYPAASQLHAQVQHWLPWVDYLMLMWFEARWHQSKQAEFLHLGKFLRQRFC
ncbi:Thiamine kinase [Serratia symbiotica]|nr:Thiamine kinase [Serratia symbiotica]